MLVAGIATPARALITGLPVGDYIGNTLLYRSTGDPAIGRLWLDLDGRYRLLIDRVTQTLPSSTAGPFRFETREGSYGTTLDLHGRSVCLSPDASYPRRDRSEQDGAIYAGTGCYRLPIKTPGQSWTMNDARGRSVTLWLIKGR